MRLSSRFGRPTTSQGLYLPRPLSEGGLPANGPYDMCWSLYPLPTNGTPLGKTVTSSNTPIVEGLFSIELDLNKLGPQPEPPRRSGRDQ